ncbi:MAG: hypothetical protein E4H40_02250 [Candidatus Brocadiia bacterium]|nr:MAG: hypothetical protein E4H40_02250 [Candidatus Brocadiia bacterium]
MFRISKPNSGRKRVYNRYRQFTRKIRALWHKTIQKSAGRTLTDSLLTSKAKWSLMRQYLLLRPSASNPMPLTSFAMRQACLQRRKSWQQLISMWGSAFQ